MNFNSDSILQQARFAIHQEGQALDKLADTLGDEFIRAISLMEQRKGMVYFIGIGKSGIICRKIAATFCSLGIRAAFIHAAEAVHGDLGAIDETDVCVLVSHSGTTAEIVNLIPHLQKRRCGIIAITANSHSILANASDVVLNTMVNQEADSRGLAPTTSTTAMLAIGDALALSISDLHGFTREDFYKNHPGGALGAQLTAEMTTEKYE